MSTVPSVRTQFLIFTLFGDYILEHGGWAWTGSLITLLRLLDVSPQAARSTLSRMNQRGWLKPEREGRHSLYRLTDKGRRLLAEGGQRIFEPRREDWDGLWHLVVYSVPERKRKLRNDLRKRLAFLGFGPLAPGTWVSAHDRRAEVEALVDDLGARAYVQVFAGTRLASGDDRDIVERCWDLTALNRQYVKFVNRWQPEYERCAEMLAKRNGLPQSECFVQRFWLVHDYAAFPRLDPNLPSPLLPPGWMGAKAAEVFYGYRELLSQPAKQFVLDTLGGPNGPRNPNGHP